MSAARRSRSRHLTSRNVTAHSSASVTRPRPVARNDPCAWRCRCGHGAAHDPAASITGRPRPRHAYPQHQGVLASASAARLADTPSTPAGSRQRRTSRGRANRAADPPGEPSPVRPTPPLPPLPRPPRPRQRSYASGPGSFMDIATNRCLSMLRADSSMRPRTVYDPDPGPDPARAERRQRRSAVAGTPYLWTCCSTTSSTRRPGPAAAPGRCGSALHGRCEDARRHPGIGSKRTQTSPGHGRRPPGDSGSSRPGRQPDTTAERLPR